MTQDSILRTFHQLAAGEPPTIGVLPDPTAAPGTVVLRVTAANLSGTDAGVDAGMIQASRSARASSTSRCMTRWSGTMM